MAFVRIIPRYSRMVINSIHKLPVGTSTKFLLKNGFQSNENLIYKNYLRYLSIQRAENRLDYAPEKSSIDLLCHKLNDSLMRFGALQKENIMDLHNNIMKIKKITSYQALFLLQCCGDAASMEKPEVRNKLVSDIWESYKTIDFNPDISHYNALLQVFVENGFKFNPLEFLSNLQEKNIQPNRITFSRLITKFCDDGDIEGANKILQFLKDEGLNVNEGVFSSLIIGYGRANDIEGAKGIFDLMKESNVAPGPDSYTALLQASAEVGDSEGFQKMLTQFDQEEIFFSDAALLEVIYSLVVRGKQEYTKEIIPRLKKSHGYVPKGINIICRLLNSGHDEVAFEIFKTLPSKAELQYQGRYIPKLLAMNDYPLTKVAAYCNEMVTSSMNIMAYEHALEGWLINNDVEKSLALMRIMRENNVPVREHYFYPLFCHLRKTGDVDKIYRLFEEISTLEIKIGSECIQKYVMSGLHPSGNLSEISDVFYNLLRSGPNFELSIIYNGVFAYVLQEHGLEVAANLVNEHRKGLSHMHRGPIVDAFFNTYNYKATACILRQLLPFVIRAKRANLEGNEDRVANFDNVKRILMMLISGLKSRNNFDEHFPILLEEMLNEGVCLDKDAVRKISDSIGVYMTPKIEDLLTQLTDPSLLPKTSKANMDQIIFEIENKGDGATVEEKLTFVRLNFAKGNREKAKAAIEALKSEGVEIPNNMYVMLANCYIEEDNLEETEKIFNYLKDEHPNFQISSNNVIKFVSALVKKDRIDDAVKICLMHSPEDGEWPVEFAPEYKEGYYKGRISNMMTTLVDKKDFASIQLIQEVLLNRNFALPSMVKPSIIRYYIQENNLDKALEEFQLLYKEHRITGAKMELTLACIEKGDTEKLQTILNISNDVHGEMNTLFDLAVAFIGAGKVRQAEKVLETSGLRMSQTRVEDRCLWYINNDKLEEFEDFVTASKNVFNIDRQRVYGYLLKGYINRNDPTKALGVWLTMQEEGIAASEDFLIKLGRFLQSKNMDVPFTIPSVQSARRISEDISISERSVNISEHKRINQPKDLPIMAKPITPSHLFRRGDYGAGVSLIKEIESKGEQISYEDNMCYITHLLIQDQLEEGLERAKKSLVSGAGISINAGRHLIQKLSKAGDYNNIEMLSKYLTERHNKAAATGTKLANSYQVANKSEEYLDKILKHVEGENKFSSELFRGFIPSIFIQNIIEKEPHLLPKVEKCAEMLLSQGHKGTYASLMNAYLILKRDEDAEQIYEKHFTDETAFDITSSCTNAFHTNDSSIFDSVLKLVNRNPEGRELMKGVIYSIQLDLLRKEARFDEAVKFIENVTQQQNISLQHFKLDSLTRLKKLMEKNNQSFPFQIPEKRQVDTSSSSSEDEKKH